MSNRRKKGKGDASASESLAIASPVGGPASASTTGGPVGMQGSSGTRSLTMVASVDRPLVSSPLGYSYRDNVIAPINADRIQMLMRAITINLDGGVKLNASDWVTGEWCDYIDDYLWPQSFPKLVALAEGRDGYKPTTDTLTNVDAIRDYILLAVYAKATARTLWALFHAQHYNQAMYAMTGLRTMRSRIQRVLELADTIKMPADFDPWITYLSRVAVPYPGGPVIFNWIHPELGVVWGNAYPGHSWSGDALPDWDNATDVGYIIDNIQDAIDEITGGSADAPRNVDYRLINSIFGMLGFPVPKPPVTGLIVDRSAHDDLFRGAFIAADTKGAGDDVYVVYPDMANDYNTLIPIAFDRPLDDLDWKGMRWAYDANHATQATGDPWSKTTENMLVYGCVCSTNNGKSLSPQYTIYTVEDGFSDILDSIDETAVAGPQEWQWGHPIGANHQWAFALAASEEAEELYNAEFSRPASVHFQMVHNHIGEAFARFLHQALKIPFVG